MAGIMEFLTITNIAYNFAGVFVGIVFGIIPGLTATLGVALFLPFTFGMEAVSAFAFLLGLYVGGYYGGVVPAILIKTPGSPGNAPSVLDGYPMCQKGQALEALSMSTVVAFIGGILSCVALIFIAPTLAQFALMFGPAEYFSMGVFGISIVSILSTGNLLKGVIAACIGLAIASIGMDPITGTLRFTFGIPRLLGGFNLIAVLIGLFALSEVFDKLSTSRVKVGLTENIDNITGNYAKFKVYKDNFGNIMRSSIIGIIVGIMPATGPAVASWLSYNECKRASKHKHLFGTGLPESVIASATAANAVPGGALVPTLTLGIPGDSVTAVMMGALMLQGLVPGPTLFVEHGDIMRGIFVMMVLANIFLLLQGLLGVKIFVQALKIPMNFLFPTVILMCFIGAYSINSNIADAHMAIAMGVIGIILSKAKYPLPPIMLGIILGPIIERNFRRALALSHGDMGIFITSPISLGFLILALFTVLQPFILDYISTYRKNKASKSN